MYFSKYLYRGVFRTQSEFTIGLSAKTVNDFGKHCVGVFSLIKLLAALKKDIPVQVFSCEFCEIFKNNLLRNTSVRLLLDRM